MVDVRTVRKKGKDKSEPITDDDIKSAIAETLKYATKPDEITLDCHDPKAVNGFMSWPDKPIKCDLWQVVGH